MNQYRYPAAAKEKERTATPEVRPVAIFIDPQKDCDGPKEQKYQKQRASPFPFKSPPFFLLYGVNIKKTEAAFDLHTYLRYFRANRPCFFLTCGS